MNFVQFAQAHGLLLQSFPPIGRWVRVPTEDHPRKKNGAAKFMGFIGWVQNHATMTAPAVWKEDRATVTPQIRVSAAEEARKVEEGRRKAAERAGDMVKAARLDIHPYLAAKGFPELRGLVVDGNLMVPMYVGNTLCGAQVIDANGGKKFLVGQRCGGAAHSIGKGRPIWCEGYATGLSVHAALKLTKMAASVVITFSAHNLQKMATDGIVIADNDESLTGENAAKATGLPYWISDRIGEDFNDYWLRVGPFQASQAIKRLLMR